jgi:hypothetical protein
MRQDIKRRTRSLLLAVAAALAAVALVTLPAAAEDLDLAGTAALQEGGASLDMSGGGQFDEGVVDLDGRMLLSLGAASEEAFAVALMGASTPLIFDGGPSLWIPLVTLSPIEGLSLGVGAGRADMIVGTGNPALNQYRLGLGGAYQGDALTFYLIGLKNFNRFGGFTLSSGDFTTYRISAGGMMTGSPVGMGIDLFYFDRAGRERFGEAGLAATPGAADDMRLAVDEVLLAGFFDGESAVYRRTFGGAKANATGLASASQARTPANIRAVGGHLDFRPMRETVFQLGAAYLQFVEDVTSARGGSADESLGTSMYLRLMHGITDGFQLRAAFDYLYSSDDNRQTKGDEDAYKVAAGLFWSW